MGEVSVRGSLFVSTFDMPRHLALVLAALERQSSRDFELWICDDGSGEETQTIIESFKQRAPFAVKSVWQEHRGFRKCRILNEALRKARGEICIFLDGDCVPHRHYVKDHLALQEEGRFLAGRRVELGPELSKGLTPEKVSRGFFDWPHPSLVASCLRGDSEFLNRSIRIPFRGLRSALGMDRVTDLKGCNYSVPKSALEALNGFDEEYEGYGREDTDIEYRLNNLGFKIKSLKGVALQFHVWHPRREFTPANDSRLEEVRRTGRIICEKGFRAR